MICSASCLDIPSRALHTWQMMLAAWLTRRMCFSSPNPISRKRLLTSGVVVSSLMHTVQPSGTWLSGQVGGWEHCPSTTTISCFFCCGFTVRQASRVPIPPQDSTPALQNETALTGVVPVRAEYRNALGELVQLDRQARLFAVGLAALEDTLLGRLVVG